MNRATQIVTAGFFFGWITAGAAFADSVTIGSTDGSGSCIPFGCKDADDPPGDRNIDPAFYLDINTEQPDATSSTFILSGKTISQGGLVTAFEGTPSATPEPTSMLLRF